MITSGSGLSAKVAANTTQFREGMTAAGFQILGENHPICPVFLGDAKLASTMAERMLGKFHSTNYFEIIIARIHTFILKL